MAQQINKHKGSETRRRKRQQAHGKKKKRDQVRNGCPTPMKTAYQTAESSLHSINRSGNAGKGWGIYECVCGWWHVTSRPGRLFRLFDDEFYRSDSYEYVPVNTMTYQEDKQAWNARKNQKAG